MELLLHLLTQLLAQHFPLLQVQKFLHPFLAFLQMEILLYLLPQPLSQYFHLDLLKALHLFLVFLQMALQRHHL
uniref:Candidate secreted effector n=1 Tax=Meloidogyne incognita TaxID=6306 RepID=A0A914M9N3_MELIC